MSDDTAPRVQVISRVGQILRVLRDEPGGLPLAEVVARTALPKSTAYRLLLALEREDLVDSVDGRFRIGRALGTSALSRNEVLRQAMLPLMRRLAAQVQETVGVGVLVGEDQVQFIEQLRWDSELSVGAIVGELYPANLSACGKSLLAAAEGSQQLLAYDREGFHSGIAGARDLRVDERRRSGFTGDRRSQRPLREQVAGAERTAACGSARARADRSWRLIPRLSPEAADRRGPLGRAVAGAARSFVREPPHRRFRPRRGG